MDRIISGRGTGKTKELLFKAKENKGIVVCANPKAMETKAHAYGLTGIPFISYYDFVNITTQEVKNYIYYIDEVEMFLVYLGNVKGYTLTNED